MYYDSKKSSKKGEKSEKSKKHSNGSTELAQRSKAHGKFFTKVENLKGVRQHKVGSIEYGTPMSSLQDAIAKAKKKKLLAEGWTEQEIADNDRKNELIESEKAERKKSTFGDYNSDGDRGGSGSSSVLPPRNHSSKEGVRRGSREERNSRERNSRGEDRGSREEKTRESNTGRPRSVSQGSSLRLTPLKDQGQGRDTTRSVSVVVSVFCQFYVSVCVSVSASFSSVSLLCQ